MEDIRFLSKADFQAKMRRRQRAWARRIEEMKNHRGISWTRIAQLASEAAGVRISPQSLKNWRATDEEAQASSVPFWAIRPLAEAVDADHVELLVELGILDESHLRLRSDYRRVAEHAKSMADELSRVLSASPVATVVEAAAQTGRWNVGVRPVIHGNDEFNVHTLDRLTITAADGSDYDTATYPPGLNLPLQAAGATLLRGSVDRIYPPPPDTAYSVWTITRIHRMRSPNSDPVILRSPSGSPIHRLLVTSTSTRAWPTETAGLVSDALGWGFVSIPWLTRATDHRYYAGRVISEARSHTLDEVLRDTNRHRNTVIGLSNLDPAVSVATLRGEYGDDIAVVQLHQSDRLLRYAQSLAAEWSTQPTTVDSREAARSELNEARALSKLTRFRVEVDLPPGSDQASYDERQDQFLLRSRDIATAILRWLHEDCSGPPLHLLHPRAHPGLRQPR